MTDEVDAVVVGGGMSGIAATIALKRQGLGTIVVLEKSDGLGGVWYHNNYPGAACDVPSPLYSYSFAANPEWSQLFAGGSEIREYFQRVAREHDVVRHVRFRTELMEARWNEATCRWICQTSGGQLSSRFLILATGHLHQPSIPAVAGIESFNGQSFHSSEWPTDFDPTGKNIAVVGTGASAIQFVPEIQPRADRLVVLQRTPAWIVPRPDVKHPSVSTRRALLRQRVLRSVLWGSFELVLVAMFHPQFVGVFEWIARKHLHRQISNSVLRAVLTPKYRFGCKRMLLSSDYYPAISSDNVDYVPSALAEVRENSVVSADGREFEVDTVIWGTGFHFADQPTHQRIRGRDGRTLAEQWQGSPRAYLSTTVTGFPNAFILQGPNTGTVSQIAAAEASVRYASSAVEEMRRNSIEAVDVRRDVEERWVRANDAKVAKSVWSTGGCTSFYFDSNGRNVGPWPGQLSAMMRRLSHFDLNDYLVLTPRRPNHAEVSATNGVPARPLPDVHR